MNKRIAIIFVLICLFLPFYSFASTGTIISPYKYAWSNDSGYINFEKVTVSDSSLGGYAWSSIHGWIKFDPAQGGVLNDGTGKLSGYAWGEQLGWINFDNVRIDLSNPSYGKFTGIANGPLIGTLTFDCNNCDVRTDWRPANSSNSLGGASGGGIRNITSLSSSSAMSSSNTSPENLKTSEILNESSSLPLITPSSLIVPVAGNAKGNNNLTAVGSNQPSKMLFETNGILIKLGFLNFLRQLFEMIPHKTALIISTMVVMPLTLAIQYLIAQTDFMPVIRSFSDLGLMFLSFFDWILTSLGIRKKRRHWGTVYDSWNKQPIDPALVELIDEITGKVIKQSITDISGRFGFLDYPGKYRIRASKTHYQFPSRLITGSTDSIYENIYHGEIITISEKNDLITPNIPMDPVAFDWNQQAKQKIIKFHPKLEIAVLWGLDFIFWLSLAFVIFNFIFEPNILNDIFVVFYVLLAFVRRLIPDHKLFGRVESKTMNVVGLIVEISLKQMPQMTFNRTLAKRVGKFFMMAPKGDYILRVKQSGDSGKVTLFESNISVGREGVVNNVIAI